MSSKGRRRPDSVLPRGSQHANAILTEELVIDLRTERRGGMTYKQLAAKYGVAFSTVADIVKRKKWRHVGG
jgi:transposase